MRFPKISRASFDMLVKDILPTLRGEEGQAMYVQWWLHRNKTERRVQMGYGDIWPYKFLGIPERSA
jgi:hypothetical protein